MRGGVVPSLNSLERGRGSGRRDVTRYDLTVLFKSNIWIHQYPKSIPLRKYSTALLQAIFSLGEAGYDTVAPFYQRAQLFGPDDAIVRVSVHVDDGSSRNCMSLARWKRYGHSLHSDPL